jgi:SAM-dependent methyltransferase
VTARFVEARRGDRLHPRPWNTRYHALKQLADAMREIAAHPLLTGEVIVDFGCADAPYQSLLAPRFAKYVRADLPGNPNVDVTIEENGRLPLADGSVHAVLSSQVLEHVADPRTYLAEARRVLAPGGMLAISTHGAWMYHPDPSDFWRWTRDGLRMELERAGFEPIHTRGVLGRGSTTIQLLQDSVADALPRGFRRLPGLVLQRVIGVLERVRVNPTPDDAAIYVVLARRV